MDGIPIIVLVFAGAIALALLIRMAAGGFDRQRIADYIESRGGKVISCHWSPFGPGWFGEKRDRIYEVHYVDRDGREHIAACKTSLMGGVYFTQDEIVGAKMVSRGSDAIDQTVNDLAEENRQLRLEIERLKREA